MITDTHPPIEPLTAQAADLSFRAALAEGTCWPVGHIDREINSLELDDPDLVLLVPSEDFTGVAQYASPHGLLLVGLVGGPWACLAADGAAAVCRLNPHMKNR